MLILHGEPMSVSRCIHPHFLTHRYVQEVVQRHSGYLRSHAILHGHADVLPAQDALEAFLQPVYQQALARSWDAKHQMTQRLWLTFNWKPVPFRGCFELQTLHYRFK